MNLLRTLARQGNKGRILAAAKHLLLVGTLLGTIVPPAPALAQGSSVAPDEGGCTRAKDLYTCDWQAFRRLLPHMRSITVETPNLDRFAASQLREMVIRLGKNVAAQEQPADLTVTLRPVEPNGVDFGPAEHPLATLQVYRGNSVTGNRKLLWVETYSGQGDRPWPSIVHALIEQFEARVGKR